MTRKRALVLALATLFLLLLAARAGADYRGSDLWSNLMPASGRDGLADRHPISYYQLDYHVDTSITGSGITSEIAQFFCSIIFFGVAVLMRLVIAIYGWAFNVDLITGATGGLTATAPIAQQNYQDFAMPFLVTAVICLGVWVVLKSVRRDHHDVGSALARVVLMTVLAIAIVQHPADTVGRAYQLTDDLATSIVTGMAGGDPADRVFETFIYRPWAILQFGGLQVCTSDQLDGDGFPIASITPGTRKVCHSVLKKDSDGHGDYARIMSSFAPDSPERNAYYDALREGKNPEISGPSPSDCPRGDCTLTGHSPSDQAHHQQTLDDAVGQIKVDKTDAPAVDMMQAGGAVQRLIYVVLIVACMISGILLLGLISIGVLFAQIALLLLVMLSGFMLLAAVYPGAHGVFRKWLSLLGKVLVGKAVYALMLGATLSTSFGLLGMGTTIGYFFAFFMQALLYAGVFWKRKLLLEVVTSRKTAERFSQSEHKSVAFATGAATMAAGAMSGGATTFASTMRQGWSGSDSSGDGDDSKAAQAFTVAAAAQGASTSPPQPRPAPQEQPSSQPTVQGGASSTSGPPETMPSPASTTEPQRQETPVLRPFSDDLASAQQRQAQPPDPPAEEEQEDYRLQPASSYQPREPVNSKQLRSFEDDLELASLAQERPTEDRVPFSTDE
jgi:hypothetical protein